MTTPPAPLGVPGAVIVEVTTVEAGSKFVPGDYTYVGSSGSPQPQTITPLTYTPTGAQSFTIQGANLGPSGGNVNVLFSGLGSVQGLVSPDATLVTGRAPVSMGMPPTGPVTVTVDSGAGTADVPTTVTYDHAAPMALPAPWQAPAGVSRPVRLSDSRAVLCTSGADNTWGNGNDDVLIISGPPTPATTRVTFATGGSIGFLDPNNSIPVVLDANTICLYSVGPNGVPDGPATVGPDDTFVVITSAQTTPVVTALAVGSPAPAPFARISSSTFAVLETGVNRIAGDADDVVRIYSTNFTVVASFPVANLDVTPGRANFSLPVSPDGGANIFVMSAGANGLPNDGDDRLTHHVVATTMSTVVPMVAQTRPLAISPTLLVAPGAGANGAFGGVVADDVLLVIAITPALSVTSQPLPTPIDLAAVMPLAPLGTGGVALPVQGTQPVVAFTDPVNGTSATLTLTGTPLLAPLGSGDLVVFTPGSATRVRGDGSSSQNFSAAPTLNQAIVVLTDADRAFGLTTVGGSALLVHQTRALNAFADTSALPVDLPGAAPITGTEPFVPVGPDWGLVQSKGMTAFWGDGADVVLVVRY